MQRIKHKLCISSFDYLLDSEKSIINVIESEPSIEMPIWIPCSERLPREYSDDERVLVTTDVDGLGVIIIPIYDVVSWYYKGYISAWMPLPKPYNADQHTQDVGSVEQTERSE